MYDRELSSEIIAQLLEAVGRIERRFSGLKNGNDFLSSDEGVDRLDGICMMLITIGEGCKNLDKVTSGELLRLYPDIDWRGVKGIRDIISHHYFDMDADIVYSVCKKHIPNLRKAFESMLRDVRT